MSLGGGRNTAVNAAVAAAVQAGTVFVVAAGNSGDDAYWYSPASEPTAITVGASNINDGVPYFTNYGPGVDVYAPGVNVLSAWIGNPTATVSRLLPSSFLPTTSPTEQDKYPHSES